MNEQGWEKYAINEYWTGEGFRYDIVRVGDVPGSAHVLLSFDDTQNVEAVRILVRDANRDYYLRSTYRFSEENKIR